MIANEKLNEFIYMKQSCSDLTMNFYIDERARRVLSQALDLNSFALLLQIKSRTLNAKQK